jgi:hypothetical protein
MLAVSRVEHLGTEADDVYRRLGDAGPPLAGGDRHPHTRRYPVREPVEGERGIEANDPLGDELRHLGERMVAGVAVAVAAEKTVSRVVFVGEGVQVGISMPSSLVIDRKKFRVFPG